jgi:hypothetical protein
MGIREDRLAYRSVGRSGENFLYSVKAACRPPGCGRRSAPSSPVASPGSHKQVKK